MAIESILKYSNSKILIIEQKVKIIKSKNNVVQDH